MKKFFLFLPSIICSLILSIEGISHFKWIENPYDFYNDTQQSLWITNIFIIYIITEFMTYFILKQKLLFLTQTFHHFIYTIFLLHLKYNRLTNIFYIFIIEEIPTFLLMIGKLIPKLNNKLSLLFTFFITRILYHSYAIFTLYQTIPYNIYTIFGLSGLILHLYWFFMIIKKNF